jgi:RNA polymerase sigma-70 factor (ECF subfamily)
VIAAVANDDIMAVDRAGVLAAPARFAAEGRENESIAGPENDMDAIPAGQSGASAEGLAELCQRGSLDAFDRLMGLFEARIFNFLCRLTPNREDAKDLTQETFLKAYRSLGGYTPSRSFAPWLFTIARRTAASHFRSAKQFEELGEESGADPDNPAGLLVEKDDSASLWRTAKTLKPKQHEVLWLRYGEGFSIAEIARVMNSNQIYVKVLLHRARASLGKKLGANIDETTGRGAGSVAMRSQPEE